MNMLPGDTKALTPSGLRLGVQELTRVGMGRNEMAEVARLFAKVLIEGEDPKKIKQEVNNLKADFQIIRYCFNEDEQSGYIL